MSTKIKRRTPRPARAPAAPSTALRADCGADPPLDQALERRRRIDAEAAARRSDTAAPAASRRGVQRWLLWPLRCAVAVVLVAQPGDGDGCRTGTPSCMGAAAAASLALA